MSCVSGVDWAGPPCSQVVVDDPLWVDVCSEKDAETESESDGSGEEAAKKPRQLSWCWDADESNVEQGAPLHPGSTMDKRAPPHVMTVTAAARSINIEPGIFFLGEDGESTTSGEMPLFATASVETEERQPEPGLEVTLAQALTDLTGKHTVDDDSRNLLVWVLEEQRSFEEKMKIFVRSQRDQLALHQQHTELHLWQLRVEVQKALARRTGLRVSTSASADIGAFTVSALDTMSGSVFSTWRVSTITRNATRVPSAA